MDYVYYYNRAIARYKSGDNEGALADFNQAAKMNPRDADIFFERGALYDRIGRLDKALEDMNEAVRLNPHDVFHFSYRADLRGKKQDFEGAIADLNRAIQLAPNDWNLYVLRGLYHVEKFHIDEAISDGEKAVALNPQNWATYYTRGRAYQVDDLRYIGQPRETESGNKSIRDLTQALRINPEFGDAYGNRAAVYIHQGRLEEAFADLKKALEHNRSGKWLMDMQLVVNSLANDGYSTIEMPLQGIPFVGGIREYNEVVKGMITDWDHYLQWRLKRKAKQTIHDSPINSAIRGTDQTTESLPSNSSRITLDSSAREIDEEASQEYLELGVIYKRRGDYLASVEAYQKSIELNYTDPIAYYSLAKIYYLLGKAREAIRNYLSTLHLSIGNMIIAYESSIEPNAIKLQRQMLESYMAPLQLVTVRQVHPYADFLWLDPNTPRHLGHVIVDLNKRVEKSGRLKKHIAAYTKALKGDSSVQIDDEIEDAHYLIVGRTFAFNNLRWISLDNRNPYTLYTITDPLVSDGMQRLFAQLP